MILNGVDKVLRMFHAHTECKGFGLDQNFFLMKKLKNIASRMTCCKNQRITIKFFLVGSDNAC